MILKVITLFAALLITTPMVFFSFVKIITFMVPSLLKLPPETIKKDS